MRMEFINITLKEGLQLANNKEDYVLLDVREPYRFQEQHLNGAVNCPYGIVDGKKEIQTSKKLIVYCDFGGQSMMAARHLTKEGYKVYNIVGGVYYYLRDRKTVDEKNGKR